MVDPTPQLLDGSRILKLARRNRAAAGEALRGTPIESQVQLVCETPVAERVRILDLLPDVEAVVPKLPEAEFCFTVKSIGVADAVWLLDCATPTQIVACLDLDAWEGDLPDRVALDGWIDALSSGESKGFLRSVQALDPEIVALYLRGRVDVALKPAESEDADWQPPIGGQTLDGQFYFTARNEGDDIAPLITMLRVLFEGDYWLYFRALQAVIWEMNPENEEFALRWRAGRLQDLGFPPWEEAMQIYRYIPPDQRAKLPEEIRALDVKEWPLPVWISGLPAAPDGHSMLLRAIAQLDAEERRASFFSLVALANKIAVADRLPLSDSESTSRALEKALRFADAGLELIAQERALDPSEILRRVPMTRLFGVGANLDPKAAKP